MKTSISKKSKVLIAVISIAVLIALTTVAVLANDTVDYGEKFNGVYLSSAGDVKLVFCYDKATTDAAGIDAFVVKYSDGREDVVYNVADLNETANGYEVSAAFAPAELNVVASVYASKENVEATVCDSYSVVDYANKVLASDAYAKYHNITEAILNYGAMAQLQFNVDTGSLVNAGLYDLGTNPAHGVTTAEIGVTGPEIAQGETITATGVQLFCQTKTTLRVYFTYEGENALTATVSGAGLDNATAAVLSDANGYYVDVTNISAKLYDDVFTFTVTNGTDTCTVQRSVLHVINQMLGSASHAKEQNIVSSMYMFYRWANLADENGEIAGCAHDGRGYTVITDEANNKGVRVCSLCNEVIGNEVDFDRVSLPTDNFYGATSEGVLVDADSSVPYERFRITTWNSNTSPMRFASEENPVKLGKYFVIKLRVTSPVGSAAWNPSYFTMKFTDKETGTAGSDMPTLTGGFKDKDNSQWSVHIVNLEWNDKATVDEATSLLFEHNDFSKGTLVDIAYTAIVDEWSDISTLVEESNVYVHTRTDHSSYMTCFTTQIMEHIPENKVLTGLDPVTKGLYTQYTYVNDAGDEIVEKVPTSVAKYYAPGSGLNFARWDSAGLYVDTAENGNQFVYERFVLPINGSNNSLAFASADNKAPLAKYLVIKMRISGAWKDSWSSISSDNGNTSNINGGLGTGDGAWRTIVFPIPQGGVTELSKLYIAGERPKPCEVVLDVAYAALCNTWFEVDALVDETSVCYNAKSTNTVVASESAKEPSILCQAIENADGSTAYAYMDVNCNQSMTIVPASVPTYIAPDTAKPVLSTCSTHVGLLMEGEGDNAFTYDRYSVTSNGSNSVIRFAHDGEGDDGIDYYIGGRYLVIKMRLNMPNAVEDPSKWNNNYGGLKYIIEDGAEQTYGGYKAFVPNEWRVVVYDMGTAVAGQKVTRLYFSWRQFYGNGTLDVAYAAFCNDWFEIDAIVTEEKAVNSTGGSITVPTNTVKETVETNDDGSKTYTYKNVLGEVAATKTVAADINSYKSGAEVAGAKAVYSSVINNETPAAFVNATSANGALVNSLSDTTFTAGRYFVIKIRGTNATWFALSFNGSKGYNRYNGIKNNDWHVFVYDLEADLYINGDGRYVSKDIPITSIGTSHNKSDFDIAYMAVCDSWAEIDAIVDEDQVQILSSGADGSDNVAGNYASIANMVANEVAGN